MSPLIWLYECYDYQNLSTSGPSINGYCIGSGTSGVVFSLTMSIHKAIVDVTQSLQHQSILCQYLFVSVYTSIHAVSGYPVSRPIIGALDGGVPMSRVDFKKQ